MSILWFVKIQKNPYSIHGIQNDTKRQGSPSNSILASNTEMAVYKSAVPDDFFFSILIILVYTGAEV